MVTVSKKKPKNAPVDLKWWKQNLESAGISQNGLAEEMNILPGGMSRRVNGFLDFKAKDVSHIASRFGIALPEAMHKLVTEPNRGN